MQTKNRKNNFDNLPPSKILPGGCSCSSSCCCCCCVHGVGFGIASTVAVMKKTKYTGGKKFLLGLFTFIIVGVIGLWVDFGVLVLLGGELNLDENVVLPLYFIISIALSILVYKIFKKDYSNSHN